MRFGSFILESLSYDHRDLLATIGRDTRQGFAPRTVRWSLRLVAVAEAITLDDLRVPTPGVNIL